MEGGPLEAKASGLEAGAPPKAAPVHVWQCAYMPAIQAQNSIATGTKAGPK